VIFVVHGDTFIQRKTIVNLHEGVGVKLMILVSLLLLFGVEVVESEGRGLGVKGYGGGLDEKFSRNFLINKRQHLF